MGTSHPIKQVQSRRSFHIKHHCEMSDQGCGGARRTRTQRTISQIQGQKLHTRLQKHETALGSGMASWEQERHSPAHAEQGAEEPLEPLWQSTRRGPVPPCPRVHTPSRRQRRAWGCHTVPTAESPTRPAKPTFPLTFSMLAHCIGMVFIEVSAKAIQTLPKSGLGEKTRQFGQSCAFFQL